ncbi:MAG TPA: uroporphyrinogen decarboxylase family protein [Thermoguttaceae bacterium]|nr:uroporphyrinogen decarboxylase family protein [Thermoguttaceae bacterium]
MSQRPLDNFRSLLDGRAGSWIPFSLDVGAIPGFSPPIERTFRRITGAEDPAEYFDADVRRFSLSARFGGDDPAALHEAVEPGTTFDEWGIGHRAADVEGTVDKTFAPLARASSVEDVEALPSPVIETGVDTSPVEAYHAAGCVVFGYAGSIYEWSWWIRGMERFLVDLVSDPPMAEALVRKIEEHTTRLAIATARAGVDVLCVYDDAGMQHGMQISPSLWRQYVKPAWRRVIEAVRAEAPQVKFFLHSCGRIDPIVPDVVELGFDVLHPVQPECMSFEDVYRRYGDRILLAATISSQKVFPFGSAEDVRREVRRLAEIAASDCRCILMPSNVIQPETPWENVVAFAEEARALRNTR